MKESEISAIVSRNKSLETELSLKMAEIDRLKGLIDAICVVWEKIKPILKLVKGISFIFFFKKSKSQGVKISIDTAISVLDEVCREK